ncbi:MAG: 50S ribosomal protein L17 [Firmicutes bacterium]|nr:50S ribosomal protein L17 [Bacillota bacterium]
MSYRKLGRVQAHRKALFRHLVTSLLDKGKISTTEAKAKEIRGMVDKMITLAKRGDLHARRQVLSFVMDEDVVTKLFDTVAPRLGQRPGGYTRIYKTDPRRGDAAPMAVLELITD